MADKTDAATAIPTKDDVKLDAAPAEAAPASLAADAKDESKDKSETSDEKKDGDKTPAAASAAQPTIEQSLEEGIGNVVKGFGSIWGVMKARVSVVDRCAARRSPLRSASSALVYPKHECGTVRALTSGR